MSQPTPDPKQADTQPVRVKATPNHPGARKAGRQMGVYILWSLVVIVILMATSITGGISGYRTGKAELQHLTRGQSAQKIDQQFQLGLQDIEADRLEIAKQRFEWVLTQDPDHPEAMGQLAKVMAILFATATPSPIPPTITLTPTPDLRPVQERFNQALTLFSGQDWTGVIDTLTTLRKTDSQFRVVEVDRMLFLSLLNRGREKILNLGDLEGGIYDLALAERFGPLDVETLSVKLMARQYLMGSSFWEVYPEQAVFFFSQVVAGLPFLRDASGWTAKERLWGSFIQWGDQLAAQEDWCAAQQRYEQALAIQSDLALQSKLDQAVKKCTPPSETPSLTSTPTLTPTPTITSTLTLEPTTITPTPTLTDTPTPTLEVSPSPTQEPTITSTPNQPIPSETPTATLEPTPTETPTPSSGGSTTAPGLIPIALGNLLVAILAIGMVSSGQTKPIKPQKTNQKTPFRNKKMAITISLIIALFILVLAAVWISFIAGKELAYFGTGISSLGGPVINQDTTNQTVDPLGTPIPDNLGNNSNSPLVMTKLAPWDGAGRVTVLLLGLDFRDWDAGEKYSRSDTMVLLTLDPITHTAGIMSIPRDMWVAIPGFKHGKINTAYYLGDAYNIPGGGPGLAVKTVESFLGVPINYYAQVDFDAFVKFIDEIGGVQIDVPGKITIDLLGAGQKTKKNLKPGLQTLPGDHALAYARARHTEGGDFDRAGRQQQVIMAIRDRILRFDLLPSLVSKAPAIYQNLSAGIHTNLSLDEIIQLALLSQSIPKEDILQGVIGKENVLFAESPDKLSILIPLIDEINDLRDRIFTSSGSLNPGTPGNSLERMQAEEPRISLVNASGEVAAGANVRDQLSAQGVNIVNFTDAQSLEYQTRITDYTGNPFTVRYLVDTYGINPNRVYRQFDPNSSVDVELTLGRE